MITSLKNHGQRRGEQQKAHLSQSGLRETKISKTERVFAHGMIQNIWLMNWPVLCGDMGNAVRGRQNMAITCGRVIGLFEV